MSAALDIADEDEEPPPRPTIVKRPGENDSCLEDMMILDDMDDDDTLLLASGYLQKLSSKQKWQIRYIQLRGDHLMYWASESRSKRNVRSGDAVSMPQCAIDLRKIKSCELGNQPYFRTPYKTQVSQEVMLK